MTLNPFNITKAVDLTDIEIKSLWVDFGLESIIKPKSPMPMMILGGKGSGKTHLMRYCSFQLQKIRNTDLIQGLIKEGYIGIYLRASGLNSDKFKGKNQLESTWNTVFSYYMELWLGQLVLEILNDVFSTNPQFKTHEEYICDKILSLFDVKIQVIEKSFSGIIQALIGFRKQVDFSVNNCALTGKLDGFEINLTVGKLIFGVPKLIVENIVDFSSIKFLYLIDEFENLSESQQKYINTLYREKELPTSFKIGSRLYGVKTKRTFSAEEENKEGSEFETFLIDDHFRKYSKYDEFVKDLCIKRIIQNGYISGLESLSDTKSFQNQFEVFDLANFYKEYIKEYSNIESPNFKKLRSKLEALKLKNVDDIISYLKVPDDPLIERTNIFLFYRFWKASPNDGYLANAKKVRTELDKYNSDKSYKGLHFIILDKFKSDIEDQLILDSGKKLYYSGIKNLSHMSFGIPRNLLKILKHIYTWSAFYNEKPFNGGKISIDSQIKGIKDAAEWFHEDARMPGRDGTLVRNGINRLAQFLREIRYSDLPPECSLCAFTLNISELDELTAQIIELSEKSSYLIKVSERHEKNSKRIDPIYQINGMLAPKWDLPIYKRGEISISKEEAKAIFNPSDEEHFKKILSTRQGKYNAPFRADKISPQTSIL